MARGRVKVEVDLRALDRLREQPQMVLKDLGHPLRDAARRALDFSLFLVPVESGDLRESAFLDGPLHNLGTQFSTTWTAGCMHPAAGAIREGFHWGEQTQPPPNFLRTAFRGTRGRGRETVASQFAGTLARLFPRGHTHPTGAPPSATDFEALRLLGQSQQTVLHGGQVTMIRPWHDHEFATDWKNPRVKPDAPSAG